MFDVPPKCPALADKLTGLFSWRHTYRVHHKQKGIPHAAYLNKSYSLTLPSRTSLTTNDNDNTNEDSSDKNNNNSRVCYQTSKLLRPMKIKAF